MHQGGIDLHVHTTCSDGTLTPPEVVAQAVAQRMRVVAITDHDTVDGVIEAMEAGRYSGVLVVPGVELDTASQVHDVHVLGYFVRPGIGDLESSLAEMRRARSQRNAEILSRLESLGAGLDPEHAQRLTRDEHPVGRPHIAAALVEAGHVSSPGEAFRRFLARGRPAFVPRSQLTPNEACEAVRSAGGLAVLAHPGKMGFARAAQLLSAGEWDGIEVFHTDHDERDVEDLLKLARDRSLLVTGGSDSHGPRSARPLGLGGVDIPQWVADEFLARAPDWWKEKT